MDREKTDLRNALSRAEKEIEKLRSSEKVYKKSQKGLQEITEKLKERVKELNCLYTISSIVERPGISLEEVLQGTVDIIPIAWQYPEIACSRIVLGDRQFVSSRFTDTPFKQSQDVVVHGEKAGFLEVCYREERPDMDEGPFLKEERSLVKVIAERIGEIVERKEAEKALHESEAKNRALLDAMPDLMFQIDQEGVLLSFHQGEFVPHWVSGELTGKNVYLLSDEVRLLPRRVLDQAMVYVRRTIETGKPQIFEQHVAFRGEARDFEVRMVACANGGVLGIVRDITRRKRLEKEILEISGREQRRIGQDLHDGLCQHLAGIGFMGKVLEKKIMEKKSLAPADAVEIVELIDQAITLTRGFARGLNPVRIETEGFMLALTELAANMKKLFGITCIVECDDPILIQDNSLATHLYRIVQEALNNAIKHGRADTVTIKVTSREDACILTVEDNGCGIGHTAVPGRGMGLNIMRYRASMIGAILDIRSRKPSGTILTCSFQNRGPASDSA